MFLNERAIADFWWQEDPERAQFIFLRRYHACRQHVVYTRPEDAPSSKHTIGRSLAINARSYASLIDKYSASAVATTIAQLVSRGYLKAVRPEDGKTMYVLEPAHVRLTVAVGPVSFKNADELLASIGSAETFIAPTSVPMSFEFAQQRIGEFPVPCRLGRQKRLSPIRIWHALKISKGCSENFNPAGGAHGSRLNRDRPGLSRNR